MDPQLWASQACARPLHCVPSGLIDIHSSCWSYWCDACMIAPDVPLLSLPVESRLPQDGGRRYQKTMKARRDFSLLCISGQFALRMRNPKDMTKLAAFGFKLSLQCMHISKELLGMELLYSVAGNCIYHGSMQKGYSHLQMFGHMM